MVYNTEHRKCHRTAPQDSGEDTNDESDDEQDTFHQTHSEEDLLEMMHFAQVTLSSMYTHIISSVEGEHCSKAKVS